MFPRHGTPHWRHYQECACPDYDPGEWGSAEVNALILKGASPFTSPEAAEDFRTAALELLVGVGSAHQAFKAILQAAHAEADQIRMEALAMADRIRMAALRFAAGIPTADKASAAAANAPPPRQQRVLTPEEWEQRKKELDEWRAS